VRNANFHAIHTPITLKPNSAGRVAFHNHIIGNARRIDRAKATTITNTIVPVIWVRFMIKSM